MRFVLTLLVNLSIYLVPAALASLGSMRLARSSQDEWKLLARVPVLPLALWGPYMAWGVTSDPTSHNLWPLELFIWGTLSLALFGGVLLARRMFGRPREPAWRKSRFN